MGLVTILPTLSHPASDYFAALEQLVGLPTTLEIAASLDPLALVRALDHLDIAWLAITKSRLVGRRSSAAIAAIAALALPANSGEEFEAR